MGYALDSSGWPIVQFKFIGRLTQLETDRYFADGDALVTGRRPYVCIMDGTVMLTPDVDFVRRQARWIHEHRQEMLQVNRGIAFVMPSALVRGLVRAVMHFQEMPVPHASFADLESALAWGQKRALATGILRAK